MQPSAPISPANSSKPSATPRKPLNWTRTILGRAALAVIFLAVTYGGFVWYTRFRGTGWSQTFNLSLWYHRNRGEDLYHSNQELLVHGNRNLREVAITFDDGPHPTSRALILDTLKQYGVHATFFDVGINMEHHAELVRRTAAEGHETANHTEHHQYLTELSPSERRREINDSDIAYCAITGGHLKLLRPPGMRMNPVVLSEAAGLGYVTVAYTTAAKDADASDPTPAQVIAERTIGRIENGSILLLHDYPSTAEALPAILDALRARGFRAVTISEMLEHLPEPVRSDAHRQLTSAP
jgi:peptidoglycan/xylan/chitin deacetylase (PgdA/CDA1 family)